MAQIKFGKVSTRAVDIAAALGLDGAPKTGDIKQVRTENGEITVEFADNVVVTDTLVGKLDAYLNPQRLIKKG